MSNLYKKISLYLMISLTFLSLFSVYTFKVDTSQYDTAPALHVANSWILTNPIHIDNNWSLTASTYDWCSGSGSYSEPYKIENVSINLLGSGSCITIQNTNEFFQIQNCTLVESSVSPDSAIRTSSANNGRILGNIIINNNGIAILLSSSNNNIVEGNQISNNGYGITLLYCYNDIIKENYIEQSDIFGIYLLDSDNNQILNNEVFNNGYNESGYHGIYISESPSHVDSINNTIKGNEVIGNGKCGIYVDSCDNNTIIGNTVNDNLEYGIKLVDSDDVNVIGNVLNGNSLGCFINSSSINVREEWNVCDKQIEGFYIYDSGTSGDFTWSQLEEFAWCEGNGTKLNPYIIEDLIIDGKGTKNAVFIRESTNYFIIRNCVVKNGAAYPDCGIRLLYVDNGQLINNEVYDNQGFGIALGGCNNFLIEGNNVSNSWHGIYSGLSSNITIFNNYAFDNDYAGIALESTTFNIVEGNEIINNSMWGVVLGATSACEFNEIIQNQIKGNDIGIRFDLDVDNNTIINNMISNSTSNGIFIPINCEDNLIYNNVFLNNTLPLYDVGTNFWDNGSLGNYYDNYTGVDLNDDGIGDTPYLISGGSNQDNFPIWEDGDDIYPFLAIIIPNDNDDFANNAPDYQITIIEVNIDQIWYVINDVIVSLLPTELTGTIDQALWNSLPNGNYILTFYVNDTAGHLSSKSVIIIKNVEETPGIPGYDLTIFLMGLSLISLLILLKKRKFTLQ